jgi:hypothetical protein
MADLDCGDQKNNHNEYLSIYLSMYPSPSPCLTHLVYIYSGDSSSIVDLIPEGTTTFKMAREQPYPSLPPQPALPPIYY